MCITLHALELIHGSVDERISFSHRSVDLRVSEDIAFMNDVLAEHETRTGNKIRLLVLDTLSQSARGLEENSAKEVSHFIGTCADFAKKHDLAIILVHHLGKDGKLRGSSAFEGNLDFLWQSERIRDSSSLSSKMLVKKNKDGQTGIGFLFELEKFDTGMCDQWEDAETTLRVLTESPLVDDGESSLKSAA
jgi:predicted ATP-dependent serine protease